MRTAAIVLAAGASTRLGEPKQLITIHGETLLARSIRIAQESGVDHVFAVLGANVDALRSQVHVATGVEIVENPLWQQGMASSVRAGVTAAGGYDAVLLVPCDQPAVTPFHLALLIASGGGKIAASTYAGRTGAPALFPQKYFPELLALEGDSGARHLLQAHKQDLVKVPLENGELDLDTPESLEATRRIWSE